MPERRIVIEDGEFLHFIMRGYTSAYAIHAAMKKEAELNENQRVIAYPNIAERLLGLAKVGLIEETKIGKPSIHGRKDYKITTEGMMQLISYILAHPKENLAKSVVQMLIEYMDRFDFDQEEIGTLIFNYYLHITRFVKEYLKYIESYNVIPPGFGKNVMHEVIETIDDAEKKNKSYSKLTKVTLEDTIEISDSAAAKAAHALRVSSKPRSKKT